MTQEYNKGVAENFCQEFDENCARIMRLDRFVSGHVWIATKFTLSEYTLQREAGIPPSRVKFNVINADGPRDVEFAALIRGHAKMLTVDELYQIVVVGQQNKKPKGVSSTDGEVAAIELFFKPGLVNAGFEFSHGPEGHKTADFYVKNKVTGSAVAVQATFVNFQEPNGQGVTTKSVNALKKYAEAVVVTVVGIICKEVLHGAYIITPALLPKLRAFTSPKRIFQPSPWSLRRSPTGSVSALLASTWVSGHDAVMATLVAYATEKTAVATPHQAPLATDFSPLMAGDRQTREMLRVMFGAHHVDGPVGSKVDGAIHGIGCQYKSAKLGVRGNYVFYVRAQAGLILDANMVPALLLVILEDPVIFIVIATRTLTGEPTIGGLKNPTRSAISMYRDSTVKCGFRSSLECEMSVFVMETTTDQSADFLIALRECDQRPLITVDRMIDIKALELVAVTREQHIVRAKRKRKRQTKKFKSETMAQHIPSISLVREDGRDACST